MDLVVIIAPLWRSFCSTTCVLSRVNLERTDTRPHRIKADSEQAYSVILKVTTNYFGKAITVLVQTVCYPSERV